MVQAKIVTGELGMAELIWAGIPQRYPKLRFIIAEAGIGWIPTVLGFMDHWWTDHRRWMEPQLEEPPSFYSTASSGPRLRKTGPGSSWPARGWYRWIG